MLVALLELDDELEPEEARLVSPDRVAAAASEVTAAADAARQSAPESVADEWDALATLMHDAQAALHRAGYDIDNPALDRELQNMPGPPKATWTAIDKDSNERCGKTAFSVPKLKLKPAPPVPGEPPRKPRRTPYCLALQRFRGSAPGDPKEKVFSSRSAAEHYDRKVARWIDVLRDGEREAPTPALARAWRAAVDRAERYRARIRQEAKPEPQTGPIPAPDIPPMEPFYSFALGDIDSALQPVIHDALWRCDKSVDREDVEP